MATNEIWQSGPARDLNELAGYVLARGAGCCWLVALHTPIILFFSAVVVQ